MLRITNLTDKVISVTNNITIKPRSYLDVQTTITPKIYQLMNMGIVTVQDIPEKKLSTDNSEYISEGSLRRKRMMDKIHKGEVKPSVSLDISSYKQVSTNESIKSKRKVNK